MNLEEYFKRIEFSGPFEKPDLATFKAIHRRMVMTVPFENLSVHCGEDVVLNLGTIYDKIVREQRGGWCMENNFLFAWALRELGYDSAVLAARVIFGQERDPSAPMTHLLNMVTIGDKVYIADVSFGFAYQLWEPIELVSGKDQPQAAGVFRLLDQGGVWFLELTCRKREILTPDFAPSSCERHDQQIYCFSLVPREIEYFTDVNQALQTDPRSLFILKSMISLQTPTGFRSLLGWTYSEVTFRPEEGLDLEDKREVPDEEVESILWEKFNLKLKNKFSPKNN